MNNTTEQCLKEFDNSFGGEEVVSEGWYRDCKTFIRCIITSVHNLRKEDSE